ncbi:hypothetical protein WMY93_013163 [Mugilogobius chulae]|uniref:C2H2-type domain-containing protein n=1 Tax=Mugilogobius chulae TaxID=88201 RepID=A0AAW0P976_9GOBI
MSLGGVVVENANNRNEGNKRLSCTFYGCKRVYSDENTLQSHLKDHEIPAQSVPGKTLMCSMIGCTRSFPDMQKLMEHQRHHHKPNVYFLCESCHAKLRSYRGLLHHLRSCSKAPRPKFNINPSPSSSTPPAPMDVDPSKPTAIPQNLQNPPLPPTVPPQLPPGPPPGPSPVHTQSSSPPVLTQSNNTPVLSPNQDLAPPHLIQQIIDSTVHNIFAQENSHLFPAWRRNPEQTHPRVKATRNRKRQKTWHRPE